LLAVSDNLLIHVQPLVWPHAVAPFFALAGPPASLRTVPLLI
jgi:hypothetical protein